MAAKKWEDMSWWGNTGATPDPVKDSERSGHWWYPTEPDSNRGDLEVWGNRGVIYYNGWEKEEAEPAKATPKPPAAQPVEAPVRTKITPSNILFDFDKAVLKAEGKTEIERVVKELKQYNKDTVVIEGHTCNVGSDAYNKGLGQRRADAVQNYMVKMGVSKNRLSTKSLGEERPAVENKGKNSPENKLNRRVQFNITMGD
jgi:OOP family OmpA-OmpF porin